MTDKASAPRSAAQRMKRADGLDPLLSGGYSEARRDRRRQDPDQFVEFGPSFDDLARSSHRNRGD